MEGGVGQSREPKIECLLPSYFCPPVSGQEPTGSSRFWPLPLFFQNRLTVRASLLVDIMLGILCVSGSGTRPVCSRRTVENLKIAYEIVRHNLQERTDKQAESEEKLSIPHYQPGCHVLIHRPVADGPNPKNL